MKYIGALVCVSAFLILGACRPSPQKLLATANKYHQNKKYKEASILYRKVISKDKVNAEAYYREGLNLLDQGDTLEAARYLRRAVDLKPGNLDAATKLTDIYLSAYLINPARLKSLLPEIVDLNNKILQRDPNNYDGLRVKGVLQLAVDHKTDDALQTFAKANQIKPYARGLAGWYAQALLSANRKDEAEALVRNTLTHDMTWGAGYDFLYMLYTRANQRDKAEAVLWERAKNDPRNPVGITNLANYLLTNGRYDEGEKVMKRVLEDPKAFPSGHELMGDFYSRARKYDQAVQQYQAGAQQDSKNELKYQQRIVAMYNFMGRKDDALKLAKNLVSKNPKNATGSELYASLLLDNGLRPDPAESIAELKTLVQNNPTNAMLHLDLARGYLLTNDSNKALSETLNSLQEEAKLRTPRPSVLVPGRLIAAKIYATRSQHAQALEQAQQVLKLQENNPEARLLRDQALIGMNQGDQAQADLESLAAQYPQSNDAHLTLANLYVAEKQWSKANEQFDFLSKANPPDPRGFIGLQEVKLAQGKADEAVQAMSALADKNPGSVDYRYELARFETAAATQAATTNPERAKTYFQQAADNYKEILKTTSNSSDIWVQLGGLQQVLGQLDAALSSYEQASKVNPQNAGALLKRGMLLDAMGHKKEAADLYNRVLGFDPDNTIALNNLAFLNADTGTNLDQAMSFAERAKKQAPHSSDISDTLGYVYLKKNLNSAALQIFRQNVLEQPKNPTFHLHLAMALLKQGDKQGAREEADKALKNAPAGQQDTIKSFVNQIG